MVTAAAVTSRTRAAVVLLLWTDGEMAVCES